RAIAATGVNGRSSAQLAPEQELSYCRFVRPTLVPGAIWKTGWSHAATPARYNGSTRENRAIIDFSFNLEQCT
ncbi:MAG: hypothetical protein WA354_15155, partial [Terracidiphilus sp.]